MFLSFSFESLLSRVSRDGFTGFLTRSLQELWLIKGLPATGVAGAGAKGPIIEPSLYENAKALRVLDQ